MATRSYVGILNDDQTVDYIYVHFDGSPNVRLPILKNHYNCPEKIRKLINLGNLSSLNEKLAPDPNLPHTWENRQNDACLAYHRDMKESWSDEKYQKTSLDSFLKLNEYTYLFDGKTWKQV